VSTSAQTRIPVEERLFSLVLALLATEAGLTKAEILSTVQGYRQRYSTSGDNANLERQFERDKDDIRELGVPLETIESPGQSGNNQNLRYRIPRGDYELPADISFSPEETTLLNLAAMVWREGSISGESRRAILKLRSTST
jgi:proteasome accessory factor B